MKELWVEKYRPNTIEGYVFRDSHQREQVKTWIKEKSIPHLLFRFSDGHQPHSLVGTFRRLMRDSGLALDANGDNRTLYSLRHTYATLAMLRGEVDIHTLSKQMGNSAAMIERHYSKLTATMAAARLA